MRYATDHFEPSGGAKLNIVARVLVADFRRKGDSFKECILTCIPNDQRVDVFGRVYNIIVNALWFIGATDDPALLHEDIDVQYGLLSMTNNASSSSRPSFSAPRNGRCQCIDSSSSATGKPATALSRARLLIAGPMNADSHVRVARGPTSRWSCVPNRCPDCRDPCRR